ncbi:MAG: UbiD family decarboxylase, partial [Thaumarchaeota archaeon]|nr:UbiD family decarboxylase [Nitrososphaerota archaeon]
NASHFMALSSISKPEPGLAKQLGLLLLGVDPLFTKIVFVNEGESVLTLERLLANLSLTGARRGDNVEIISDAFCIKLDPSSDSKGTNGKMIVITKSSSMPYRKVVESEHKVRLLIGTSSVVFSHEQSNEGAVNVILDHDIDLTNPNQIIWAFSTRLRPDTGIFFEADGKLVMRATKPGLEMPTLPREVVEKVRSRIPRS